MAQSGFTPISLYFSATGAAVPTAANLVAGELALNTNDGKLYFKNSAGVVTLLAGSTSGPAGGSNTQVQYNNSGVLAGITGATTNGTVLTLVTPVLGVATATSLQGIIGNVTPAAGTFTTLTTSSTVTHNGGTANGVAYLDASKVLTTGSALTFNGTNTFTVIPATGTAYNRTESTQYSTFAQHFATSGNTGVEYKTAYRFVDTDVGELMRLTSTGLGIGTSSPTYKLDVYSASAAQIGIFNSTTGTGSGVGSRLQLIGGTKDFALVNREAASIQLYTSDTLRATLDSAGNLGLGVTPSAWNVGKAVQIGASGDASLWGFLNSAYLSSNAYYNSNWLYYANAAATQYLQQSGQHIWYNAPSGTTGNLISFTQAMTLDASGNLMVGTTSTSSRLQVFATSAAEQLLNQSTASSYARFRILNDASNGLEFIQRGSTAAGGLGLTASAEVLSRGAAPLAIFTDAAQPLVFGTTATERARIPAAGGFQFKTTISVGDATPSSSGAGITFPATQSASSDANTLDDYEEGTWTPSIGGTATYTSQTGTYTKIGNVVTIRGILSILLKGTGSATEITGLPFAGNSNRYAGSVSNYGNLAVNVLFLGTFVQTSTLYFISQTTAGTTVTDTPAILGNSAYVTFSATYLV